MGFRLVIGFINHLQVVTTSTCNTVTDFHTTNHSMLIFSVYFHLSSLSISWKWICSAGTVEVSLNYTLPVSLYYITHKVFKSHVKPSQADFNYELPVAISYHKLNYQLFWEPRYIALAWTRITGNMSHDRYCCVTSLRITDSTCHMIFTHCCVMSLHLHCIATVQRMRRKHFHSIVAWCVCWNVFTGLLPSHGLHNPVVMLCVGPCYGAIAWQCFDQIRYSMHSEDALQADEECKISYGHLMA
jgi:hypothetical protein